MVANAATAEPTRVPRPAERVLLAVLVALAIVPLVAGVALSLTVVGRPGAISVTPLGELGTLVFGLTIVALGVVLRNRRPDNPMGWLFVAFGLVVGPSALVWALMAVSSLPGGEPMIGTAAAWVGAVAVAEGWTYLITAVVVRFPSGHPQSSFERRILYLAAASSIALGITAALRPGPLLVYPVFDNPIETPVSLHPLLVGLSNVAIIVSLVPGALAAGHIIRRYRRAGTIERLQLRWFAYGASLLVAASGVYIVVGVVVAADNRLVRELTYALFAFSACSLPVAVFQAITSHRLFEIDRIISRTVAYGLLTAVLAGIYTASVRLFNALFVAVTGEANEAALVLTTLVLATTFTPIKTRLERLAAKRFDPTVEEHAAAASLTPEQQASVEEIARRVALQVVTREIPGAGSAAPVGGRSRKPPPR